MDAVTLKYGAAIAIAFYVIERLFKLVNSLVKTKKAPAEQQLKESSRTMIQQTHDTLVEVKPAFWETKNQCNDIHKIITASDKGAPLVYNKGLEASITSLNFCIQTLSTSITSLGENCKKHQG